MTVTNPIPSVSITLPTAGQTVSGITAISTTGVMPAELSYSLNFIEYYVDGASQSFKYCNSSTSLDPKQCTLGFTWDTTGLSGTHTLNARFYYDGNQTYVTSTPVTVRVWTGTYVNFSAVTPVRAGTWVTVGGRVTSSVTGQPIPGATVNLVDQSGLGVIRTVRLKTDGAGWFRMAAKVYVNHTFTASTARGSWFGPSRRAYVVGVVATISCRLAARSVYAGQGLSGSCRVNYLPAGTRVWLQYDDGYSWRIFGTWSASGNYIPFYMRFGYSGRYFVRLVVGGSPRYVQTASAPFVLQVV